MPLLSPGFEPGMRGEERAARRRHRGLAHRRRGWPKGLLRRLVDDARSWLPHPKERMVWHGLSALVTLTVTRDMTTQVRSTTFRHGPRKLERMIRIRKAPPMKLALCLVMAVSLQWILGSLPARADWGFSGSPTPNAFIQSKDMTLELQCDRIRFAPASYADALDIAGKQGLSIRFLSNGSTEVGAFQAGPGNATIGIVDNFPVEIVFSESADFNFVLEQIARNAVLNLSEINRDVSYGIFSLKGSGAAIKALRAACRSSSADAAPSLAAPAGVTYCGGGEVMRRIDYVILENAPDQWDARVTVNGDTVRAMSAYSYFGNTQPPKGFVVALLGEDRSEFLVFRDGDVTWLAFGDDTYRECH
jgi:hypothetical protein